MNINWSYYEDEVRDGFFVPGLMKKSWAYSMKLYRVFHQQCLENHVDFAVAYGTILGAVRHGGYVPWDDDIDVEMMRDDYEILFAASQRQTEYMIEDYRAFKDPDCNFIRAFTEDHGRSIGLEDYESRYGFPFPSVLDLHVADYVPRNKELYEKARSVIAFLYTLTYDVYSQIEGPHADVKSEKREAVLRKLQKSQESLGIEFQKDVPMTVQLYQEMEKTSAGFMKKQSDYRGLVFKAYASKPYMYLNRAYEDYIDVSFEEGTVRIPVGYDHILRTFVGNYMYPVLGKSEHPYPGHGKYEEQLGGYYGGKLLRYGYDGEKVKRNSEKNGDKICFKDEMQHAIQLLEESQRFVLEHIVIPENNSEILDVLQQCQEVAIYVGERLEERAVDSEPVISLLERYCEIVYRVYEIIETESDTRDGESEMKKVMGITSQLLTWLEEEMIEKKEIVFLVYKREHWKSLHTLWEAAINSPDTIVTVIPIPYFYKDFLLDVRMEPQLEEEGYPEEVSLTSYRDYNFEAHHPDVLIYQCPYDEYNHALTLHPFYYASNLRQYVEKMVFIPPFELREIDETDMSSRYTMKWFLNTPGLIYADLILVQSPQMKCFYEEILSEFTAGDESINWSERIISTGFPLWDWEQRERERIAGAKRKKVLLYYVSVSVLHQYQWKCLSKIRNFLEVVQRYQDEVEVIWYQDPYIQSVMEKKYSDIWEAYCQLLNDFKEKNLGEVKEEGDYEQMARHCDAIYGDGGVLMTKCREEHKLVLFETPEVSVDFAESNHSNYKKKTWTPDILVAEEGEWSLDNLLQEMLEFSYEPPMRNCGKRVWETISR